MYPTRFRSILLSSLLVLAASSSPASDPDAITVPSGYTVGLAAEQPLVGYPMMGCFDDRGRLFLAESAGFNRNEKQLDATRPNFIRMIEDTDHDGVFDKSTIFADKLALPNGALWLDGSLYVAEPPGIWRFTDTNDDGIADLREHIAGNVRSNGMSSTLHGPSLHPSGLLFWCGGQLGYSLEKGQEPPSGRIAPGVFTLRADGSDHEIFSVGGIANPVEVAFSETGDIFGTLAILDRPDGVRHDGLLHWVYGGRFRPRSGVPIPLKSTGPSLPPLSHVRQVAPAGLALYRGSHLGKENRGAIFWSQFNTRTVMRTMIQPKGATYVSKDEPFLVSSDIDFHPTDVIEDADGSLLIIDTGGWFRHGCPTSHIAKREAKGAIYRVQRNGGLTVEDPRGLAIRWNTIGSSDLANLLEDPRPAVRDRAIARLARHEEISLPALANIINQGRSPTARRNAIWALARIDTPASLNLVRDSISDLDPTVRKAAAFSLGIARHSTASARLVAALKTETDPHALREIATALGRIGDPEAIPALAGALENNSDAFSRHSLIYAIIEIGIPEPLIPLLTDSSPGIRRGALIALSQMERVELQPHQIAPLLKAAEFEIREAAFTVALSEPRLFRTAAQALLELIPAAATISQAEKTLYFEALSTLSHIPESGDIIATLLGKESLAPSARILLIDVIANSKSDNLPNEWTDALKSQLASESSEVRLAAIRAIGSRHPGHLDSLLHGVALNPETSLAERLAAINAIGPRLQTVDEPLFRFLVEQLDNQTATLQLAATRTLASLKLSQSQLLQLAGILPTTDALTLPTLVRAFATPAAFRSEQVGHALVSGLKKSKTVISIPADELARLIDRFPDSTRIAARPILANLGADLEAQQARLAELSPLLSGGDFGRGKQIFFTKAGCAACHRVSGQGGELGPNLSAIAAVRSSADLLESVVFPSASIVQGYESYIVETKSGETHSGIALSETQGALSLIGGDLSRKKIPLSEIATRRIAPASLMPQGLDYALNSQEFADLMAFLQGLEPIKSYAPDEP